LWLKLKKIDKIINLGGNCDPMIMLPEIFHETRMPFDFSIILHEALLNMLRSKFTHLNYNENLRKLQGDKHFRVSYYNLYEGFYYGHQKLNEILPIHTELLQRCKNFLQLSQSEESVLFIRKRNNFFDKLKPVFFESFYAHDAMQVLQNEYDELKKALQNFGFKNFELAYVICTPLKTLDGFVNVTEGALDNYMYVLEDSLCKINWSKFKNYLKQHFEFEDNKQNIHPNFVHLQKQNHSN